MRAVRRDLLVLLAFNILVLIYALTTADNFIGKPLIVGFIFLVPQAVYLSLRKKKNWRKITLATLIFGGLMGFFFEFIQELNLAYHVPFSASIFQFKLFGVVPPDNVLGHMVMTFSTMVAYEHLLARKIDSKIPRLFSITVFLISLVIILMIFIFYKNPALLKFDYSYGLVATLAIIPVFIYAIIKPDRIKEMSLTGIYFFFFYLMFELLAVKFNWWIYPGNSYIGWVNVFGLNFPFEELFFWMIFYPPALISYRELFLERHT